jgi:hypothetical protein
MSKEIPLRELKIIDSRINKSINHILRDLSEIQVNYEDQGIENYMHQYLEELYGVYMFESKKIEDLENIEIQTWESGVFMLNYEKLRVDILYEKPLSEVLVKSMRLTMIEVMTLDHIQKSRQGWI